MIKKLLLAATTAFALTACGDRTADCQREADNWRQSEKSRLLAKVSALVTMGADLGWGDINKISNGLKSGKVSYKDVDIPDDLIAAASDKPAEGLDLVAMFDLMSGKPSPRFNAEQRVRFDRITANNAAERRRHADDKEALSQARSELTKVDGFYAERLRSCGHTPSRQDR